MDASERSGMCTLRKEVRSAHGLARRQEHVRFGNRSVAFGKSTGACMVRQEVRSVHSSARGQERARFGKTSHSQRLFL